MPRDATDLALVPAFEDMLSAPDREAVWAPLVAAAAEAGFDRLLYGLTSGLNGHSIGGGADHHLLSTHDPAYLEEWLAADPHHHSAVIAWGLRNDGVLSWGEVTGWLATRPIPKGERRLIEINRRHGVEAGYSISLPSLGPRHKGMISFVVPAGETQHMADAAWARHGHALRLLAELAHLRFAVLPSAGDVDLLTERQREVLLLIADGKTTADAAVLLDLSAATVEKHLKGARDALNAQTTPHALMIAASRNLLTPCRVPPASPTCPKGQ